MADRVRDRVQIYSGYDKAIVDWVHSLQWKDRPLLCVFATPERAFAQLERRIRQKTGRVPDVFPLPFASIHRTGSPIVDHQRYNNAYLKRIYFKPATRKYVGTAKPTPVTLVYEVNLWTRLLEDLDWLTEQVYQHIRPAEFWLQVEHPEPVGTRWVLLEMQDMRDTSQLEPNDKDRVLRRIIPFKVHAWMCMAATEYGIVEQVTTEVIESLDLENETLDRELDEIVVSDTYEM